MRSSVPVILVTALSGAACAPDAASEGDATPAPSTTATTTATTTLPAPLQAAVVAETDAGSAPALVRVAHATTRFVTLGLSGAYFDKVPAGVEVERQLSVSDDVEAQVKVGYCETPDAMAPCVFVKLDPVTGPSELVPTSVYTLWVDELPDAKWSLDVQTAPAEPFLALRIDVAGSGPRSAEVTLAPVAGEPPVTVPFVLPNHGGPTAYAMLPLGASLDAFSYVDPYGVVHQGSLELTLDGAYAYTIAVDVTVPSGALASVELDDGSP
jgi:hypothetical protein